MKPLKKLLPLVLFFVTLISPILGLNELIKIQLNESSNQFLINLSEKNISIYLSQYSAYLNNQTLLNNLTYLVDEQNNTYLFYNNSLFSPFSTFYLVKEGISNIMPISNDFEIVISNPNSYDLTDFQVKVNITNITQSIGYNFIIKDQNGNNVNYCFEQANGECNQTPSNVIWVKVPFIPANGEAKLYIYQSDTNNAVNGDQVFDFYTNNTLWFRFENSNMEFNNRYYLEYKSGYKPSFVKTSFSYATWNPISNADYYYWFLDNLYSSQYFNNSQGTLVARIKIDKSIGSDLEILSFSTGDGSADSPYNEGRFDFRIDKINNVIYISVYKGTTLSANYNFTDGQEYLIMFQWNSNGRRIYINGQLVASDNLSVVNNGGSAYDGFVLVNPYCAASGKCSDNTYGKSIIDELIISSDVLNLSKFQFLNPNIQKPTYIIQESKFNISQFLPYLRDYNITEYKLYLNNVAVDYPLPNYFNNQTLIFNFILNSSNIQNPLEKVIINNQTFNNTININSLPEGNYSIQKAIVYSLIDGFNLSDYLNITKWFVVDRTFPNISVIIQKPNEGFYATKQNYSINVTAKDSYLDTCYFDSDPFNFSYYYSNYIGFGKIFHKIICQDKAGNKAEKNIEFEGYQTLINLKNEFLDELINFSDFDYIKINVIKNNLVKDYYNFKQDNNQQIYYISYEKSDYFELNVQSFGSVYFRRYFPKEEINLYLVDLLKHPVLKITWALFSLVNVNEVNVSIKKQTEEGLITIDEFPLYSTEDSYLVQGERYLIEYSYPGVSRIWGTLQPTQTNTYVIELSQIKTKDFQTLDKINFSYIYNGTFFKFHYLDPLNSTSLFKLEVKIANQTYNFKETNKSDILINLNNVPNSSFAFLEIYINSSELGEIKLSKIVTNEQSSASNLGKWLLFLIIAVAGVTSAIAVPIASIVISSLLSLFVLFGIIDINPALLLILWFFTILLIAKRGDVR